MDLHSAGHRRGVVAAPHHAAAAAGRDILAEGGNALEAMVAMAATIAAVYPHMNHVGGDGFFLVRERSGRVRALMAAGRAGAKASIEFYRADGHDVIPERGPLAALTVPSAVAGWMLALEAAKAQGGRMPLAILLEAAIRHARDGYVVTRSQARLTAEKLGELKRSPGFAATFLADGKPPQGSASCNQAALAATFDQLAKAGLDDFYRGDVGREIAADLARIGTTGMGDRLDRGRLFDVHEQRLLGECQYGHGDPTDDEPHLRFLHAQQHGSHLHPDLHGRLQRDGRLQRLRLRAAERMALLPTRHRHDHRGVHRGRDLQRGAAINQLRRHGAELGFLVVSLEPGVPDLHGDVSPGRHSGRMSGSAPSDPRQPLEVSVTGPHDPPAVALRRTMSPGPRRRRRAVRRLQLLAVDHPPASVDLDDERSGSVVGRVGVAGE